MSWRRRRPTWHERHPLPAGWRPRTRVDAAGREVEPWGWLVSDAYGEVLDGGEWWLPVGHDPDEAAYAILNRWLDVQDFLAEPELPGLRLAARLAVRYDGHRAGVAFVAEQALTGRP